MQNQAKSNIIFAAISLSYYPNICTDKNCYWKRQSDTPRNGGKSPKLEKGSSQSSYTLHSSASGASLQKLSRGSLTDFARVRLCATSAASSSTVSQATLHSPEVSSATQTS
jgi:hypothetical protein